MLNNNLTFELMTMLASLSSLAICSHIAIKNTIKASELTGLSTSRIGFTLIAVSTSLPELAVAMSSAISGTASVSIGNILGSNVANIFLISGLGLILASYKLKSSFVMIPTFSREELDFLYYGIFISSVVPLILVSLLPANSFVGSLLIMIYIYYTIKIIFRKGVEIQAPELQVQEKSTKHSKVVTLIVISILGIIGVVLSAHYLVDSTSKVALFIRVPASLISATIVAVGTSLPELALDIQAILKGELGLAFGNIIGSCFTNITLILGVTLLLSPININIRAFSDLVMFSILANIVIWHLLCRGKFKLIDGLYLLSLYLLFLGSIMGLLTFD
ncbi:MAG: sodium:calcium antiporter [Thermoproteota archaeon]